MFNPLRKPTFGLDISDNSVEIISLEGSPENPKLLALGRKTLNPGIIEDGRIIQKEKLENSLRDLIKNPQFGEFKTGKFVFSVPESKILIHIFKVPEGLKKEEIRSEVELQASQNFPFHLQDLSLDYTINNKEVLLVAAQKDTVDGYLKVFKDLKIKPIALEPESISLGRVFAENNPAPALIADIGARTTNFSIFEEKRLRLSITTDIAGNKLTDALAKQMNLSFSKAENLKKEIGLDPEKEEGKVFLILQKEIRGFISEIIKIQDYFREKEKKEIDKIILAGGSAALSHLSEYLSDNLDKPVLVGDPWRKINIDILRKKEYFQKALEINPILYAVVIGSALRGLTPDPRKNEINLLPKK